jgi:hypothetical protein
MIINRNYNSCSQCQKPAFGSTVHIDTRLALNTSEAKNEALSRTDGILPLIAREIKLAKIASAKNSSGFFGKIKGAFSSLIARFTSVPIKESDTFMSIPLFAVSKNSKALVSHDIHLDDGKNISYIIECPEKPNLQELAKKVANLLHSGKKA